jgi:hypothetical protein
MQIICSGTSQDVPGRNAGGRIVDCGSIGSVLYARPFYETRCHEVVGRDITWDGGQFFRIVKRLN